ncbi:MAG: hypothetical protein LBH04_08590 [Tannerellaceae bacterium]|jgi:hypothetical protein|nr:hypothetical protein [Tannerellaceae bacterium]
MFSNLRDIIYSASGLLLLAGAVLYLSQVFLAQYFFAVGAAGLAVSHLTAPVKHLSTRGRRLQTFNVIAGLLMLVASVFMFKRQNEWVICLAIAAILQCYAAFFGHKEK